MAEAERVFKRLVVPVLGEEAASELFLHWRDRYGSGETPNFEVLGHLASFIIGEYDDASMKLDAEDWETIREILSAEAETLNLDELTRLMGDLVSRGALG